MSIVLVRCPQCPGISARCKAKGDILIYTCRGCGFSWTNTIAELMRLYGVSE